MNPSGGGSSEIQNDLIQEVFGEEMIYDFGELEFLTYQDITGEEPPDDFFAKLGFSQVSAPDFVYKPHEFYRISIDGTFYTVASASLQHCTIANDVRDEIALVWNLENEVLYVVFQDENSIRGKRQVKIYKKTFPAPMEYQAEFHWDSSNSSYCYINMYFDGMTVDNIASRYKYTLMVDGTEITIQGVLNYTKSEPWNIIAKGPCNTDLFPEVIKNAKEISLTITRYEYNSGGNILEEKIYHLKNFTTFTDSEGRLYYIFGENFITNSEVLGS